MFLASLIQPSSIFTCHSTLKMHQLVLVAILYFTSVFGQQTKPQVIAGVLVDPNRHREHVDPTGQFQLEWFVDWQQERVYFNISAPVTTNLLLGLSLNPKLDASSDVVVVTLADNNRMPHCRDFHVSASNLQQLVSDKSQDWTLHSATQSGARTFASVSRPFDTCNDGEDLAINFDSRYILWGYGNGDVSSIQIQGAYVAYILDRDFTPQSIKDFNAGLPGSSPHLGGGVQRWNLHEELVMPTKETTYWCDIHKLVLPKQMHIIGVNVRVNPVGLPHVHHMILTRCVSPPGFSTRDIFERFVNFRGEECYDPTKPLGIIPTPLCGKPYAGMAIGMRPYFLPDHISTTVGKDPEEFYLLQVHYNNPELLSNVKVIVDVDLYYSPRQRAVEGAEAMVGQTSPGSPGFMVPMGEKSHRIHGHCSSDCTKQMLPPQGIRISLCMLHAHNNIGKIMKFQHFRGDKELKPIMKDENYQKLFQNARVLEEEALVLPGDQLVMSCYYDTTKSNNATKTAVGGWSTEQEMCFAAFTYYDVVPDDKTFAVCRSELLSPEYNIRYLDGLRNYTWDQSRLEYQAVTPPNLKGMAISEISDHKVNWTPELRRQLQQDHVNIPQTVGCPDVVKIVQGVPQPPPSFASYPVKATPFQENRKCAAGRRQLYM